MADDTPEDEVKPERTEENKPKQGSVRFQDSSTKPRPPTLAEKRARERAAAEERERQEAEEVEQAQLARKKKIRKRALIGGGVGVGLVGVIAASYALSGPSTSVTARCTDNSGVVVDDQYCNVNSAYYSSNGGSYNPGTGWFLFSGGRQYHYYYGGSGSIGQRATGGTITAPSSGTEVKSSSGQTIQRGGFGVKGGSGDSGSSAGKSGGSSGGKSGTSGGS
ncbi:hypothetical protein GCM10010174_31410 [Kutzneria viridogrisea]|uniref:Uncharacterized protein n=2 Tax=Kutzneria TaxID=43356 RepID=A0ABR6BQX4_9PSEU|nr:hypothetical protein [Kutzneria albida]AHH93514.1 putative membrane protein [Kutzneria albida DSM 43870]MBA8929100.1 hypothetical protein [Kutzneria viridogrisea]